MTPTPIHRWCPPGVSDGYEVSIKREDLAGCTLSGNKVGWVSTLCSTHFFNKVDPPCSTCMLECMLRSPDTEFSEYIVAKCPDFWACVPVGTHVPEFFTNLELRLANSPCLVLVVIIALTSSQYVKKLLHTMYFCYSMYIFNLLICVNRKK